MYLRMLFIMVSVGLSLHSLQAQTEMKFPKTQWTGYYAQATVGDYVEYSNADGTPNNRKEILAIDDHRVTVLYTVYLTATQKNEFKQIWVFSEPDRADPLPEKVELSQTSCKTKAGEFDCEVKTKIIEFGPNAGKPGNTNPK